MLRNSQFSSLLSSTADFADSNSILNRNALVASATLTSLSELVDSLQPLMPVKFHASFLDNWDTAELNVSELDLDAATYLFKSNLSEWHVDRWQLSQFSSRYRSEPGNVAYSLATTLDGTLSDLNHLTPLVERIVQQTIDQRESIAGPQLSLRPDPNFLPSTLLSSPAPTVSTTPGLPAALLPAPAPITFTNLVFNGKEGATGTVQVALTQAPTTPVTLTLTTGNFLVVDADNNLQNGTQTTLTFTAQNWNQPQTLWFIAEVDGVAIDRLTGNLINYSLTGGTTASGNFDLGVVRNTYSPDLNRFNIDLDFRNDTTGFWTEARQAIAQKAADDWAVRIANEWNGLQLNTTISKIGNDGNYSSNRFATKRYVDDLVVFVNTINSSGAAGGYGGIEYDLGGWATSPELKPRVGQIVIDPAVGDRYLYNAVLHELGHTLGLVGLNWEGFLQQNLATPQTAVFNGIYSTAANGGTPIPLQSQNGANPVTGAYDYWHPANQVYSAMSYTYLYSVAGPTAIDFAILADSGYRVYGVNTPAPTTAQPSPTVAVNSGSVSPIV